MTKRYEATLVAIADHRAGGLPQSKCALLEGVSIPGYWGWMNKSRQGDPSFMIEFCGERMQFCDAMDLARKMFLQDVRDAFELRGVKPSQERVFFQGRPMWVEDEDLVNVSDEDLAWMGYPDRYLRDRNGRRIQHVIEHAPPVAAAIKILESNFVQYRPKSEQNVTVRASLGVTTVQPQPLQSVTVIEPRTLEPPVDRGDDDDDASTVEATPIEDAEPVEDINQIAPPESSAAPPEAQLSDLQRDLLSRMAAREAAQALAAADAAKRPATVQPPLPLPTTSPDDRDDYSTARTGAGVPPPGGISLTRPPTTRRSTV